MHQFKLPFQALYSAYKANSYSAWRPELICTDKRMQIIHCNNCIPCFYAQSFINAWVNNTKAIR